jgi:plasmid stabilization system protein ParE
MRRIVIVPKAVVDIREAARWYDGEKAGMGSTFSLELSLLFREIAESPLPYPRIGPKIRKASSQRFPYFVYFTADEEKIVVLALLHHRRLPNRFRRQAAATED